jgi:hypothetical protein
MWAVILLINSIALSISGLYFVYSIGLAILSGQWKVFFAALLVMLFLSVTEVVLGAILES